jgi:preprotein translocase subunit YajC
MKGNTMKMTWIVAQTGSDEAPEVITSEPVGAEETQTMEKVEDANAGQRETRGKGPLGDFWLIGLMVLLMVMVFSFFRGPRKQQQEQRKMLQSLQKNDRVRTIGGIIGTVVDVKGEEVTLKVDESNNTKIKVLSSAIGKNLSKDTK